MDNKCCLPVKGFYLGTSCPICNKPFRIVLINEEVTIEYKDIS